MKGAHRPLCEPHTFPSAPGPPRFRRLPPHSVAPHPHIPPLVQISRVQGAGVLSGYDQLQVLVFGKAFSGGGG